MQYARVLLLPMVCCVPPMHQTTVPGRFSAMVCAARLTWSPGIPVTFSTTSGVHCATSVRTASMPNTRWFRYSLSSHPFSKMCQSMPQISGTSVPGRSRMYWSACAAVRVKRGSTTINFAPFSLPRSTCCIETGCASAALLPMKNMALARCMSL